MMPMKVQRQKMYWSIIIVIYQIKLDRQDFIGETICALSSIVHKNTATILDLKLNNKIRGQITIKCEELGEANGIIRGCFKGLGLSKKSFYRIFNIDEKNGSTPMYKSEVAKQGGWNAFEIHSQLFCNGDLVIQLPLVSCLVPSNYY